MIQLRHQPQFSPLSHGICNVPSKLFDFPAYYASLNCLFVALTFYVGLQGFSWYVGLYQLFMQTYQPPLPSLSNNHVYHEVAQVHKFGGLVGSFEIIG